MKKRVLIIGAIVVAFLFICALSGFIVYSIINKNGEEVTDSDTEQNFIQRVWEDIFDSGKDESEEERVSDTETNSGGEIETESEPEIIDYTGKYVLSSTIVTNPTSTSTETETVVITVTVSKTGEVNGEFDLQGRFEATTTDEIVDSKSAYTFSGEIDDNGTFEDTITYIATTDNNKVLPYHREFDTESIITIIFTSDGAQYTEAIQGKHGVIERNFELEKM